MRPKNLLRIVLAAGALLLVPLVAMQWTHQVAWSLSDFVVAGALLVGTGLLYELAAGRSANLAYRVAAGVTLAGALFLVWVNLAVGMIGSETNPANLMYLGVLAVGLVGALGARFQAQGMMRALLAMAVAQALVAGIALAGGMNPVLPLDACFVALWVGAALLFRHAGAAGTRREAAA